MDIWTWREVVKLLKRDECVHSMCVVGANKSRRMDLTDSTARTREVCTAVAAVSAARGVLFVSYGGGAFKREVDEFDCDGWMRLLTWEPIRYDRPALTTSVRQVRLLLFRARNTWDIRFFNVISQRTSRVRGKRQKNNCANRILKSARPTTRNTIA
jgi:hypothetical protein